MKLTAILLLTVLLNVQAEGYSQISIHKRQVSLQKVFWEIKKQSGYNILYRYELIENVSPVSVDIRNASVSEALNECLKQTNLSFEIWDQTIIIKRRIPFTLNHSPVVEQPPVKVSGKVVDESGNGVAASVVVKGSGKGTTTNSEGYFELEDIDENSVLVITGVGIEDVEFRLEGRKNILIKATTKVTSQSEIVVTALGIGKDRKSITYATQSVDADEVTKVKDPSFMNALAGKVSGAIITKGNFGPGSPTKILLRGDKSFIGNSEPLYVIDGAPMYGGSALLANMNPEDIESMQVMKGASAAALYGSQAANGVLLITTKKGKNKGVQVNVSSQATLENAVDLPELQTNYGRTIPAQNDSWGEKVTNGSDSHLKEFFKTGLTLVNGLSVSGGNEQAQVYMSYANTDAKGIMPENNLSRNNFTIKGSTQLLNKKLTLDGSVNYTNQKVYGQNSAGGYSALPGIYSFPVDDDFSKYNEDNFEVWDPVRQMYVQNWAYNRNETFPNQNPYWVQKRNQRESFRDNSITSFTAKYKFTNWLNLQARGIYNKIDDKFESRDYASTYATVAGANGGYGTSTSSTTYFYSDVLLTSNKNLGDDFSLSVTLGASETKTKANGLSVSSTVPTSLTYPNYFSIYALNGLFNKSEYLRRTLSRAIFGNVTLGYLDKLYLDVTARKEWSSTISQAYSYPSIGLSYLAINYPYKESLGISYLKFRASYAEVGNSLPFGIQSWSPPYTLDNSGNINPRGSLPFFDGADTTNLKPERTKSYELGADLRLLNDKLGINLTWYSATTFDQVFQIQAPAGAGATNFWINGGTIRNEGIEGTVSYKILDGRFQWTTALNFSYNKNTIREISTLLNADYFVLGGSYREVQLFLTRPKDGKYGSYGDMYGKIYERDEHGDFVLGNDGLPKITGTFDYYLGNANPKFLAGLNNSFSYKNILLSFLVDSRFGGKVYNRTEQWLDYKGLSKRTGEARDNGGVEINGSLVDAKAFYMNQTGAGAGGAAEGNLYDVTNVRLRELSLGYSFNQIRAFRLNLSLVGRNLFFFYKKAPFDPEIAASTSQTAEGISSFTMPAVRSFGLNLTATF
ncbi:MAG: SusC/RagA family TonB-linked outer membrane protein [Chitinophagaceae bacterium]|nr:SusC/RagA family TonB-linked outer membrane protein [Chitinophagaceae bacterium]MCW5926445.1 SusC/RagA family TonB-linked outer membrane protein [Chitinophagaceae bacterium]